MTHRFFNPSALSRSLVLVLAFLCLVGGAKLTAQGIVTGNVSGAVVDADGAILPGAEVQLQGSSTGIRQSVRANEQGLFSFRSLGLGKYAVVISSPGFASVQINDVQVTAGGDLDLGKAVLAAGASDFVTITEAAKPLLQTEQSQITTSVPEEVVASLPINGRMDNLIGLAPGTVRVHDGASSANGDSFSINGQRSASNNYELDGQGNNDNYGSGPQVFFNNQDAVKEVQVISSNFSAQYGRNMGGVVNYVTRNGTNAFHGTAYEYYIGSIFNAVANTNKTPLNGYCPAGQTTGCTPVSVPRYNNNRFGGTFGGPIYRDKVWFFGGTNWERTRRGAVASVSTNPTPTLAGLAQLAAAFPGNPGVSILQSSGPFAITTGSPQAVSPTLASVTVGATTVSNVQMAKVSRTIPSLFNNQDHIGRLDWQATANDHAFIRYIYQDQLTTNAGGTIYSGYSYNLPRTTHSIGADWAHTFSANWVNQLRYSFQQTKLAQEGGTVPTCKAANQDSCTSFAGITGSVQIGYTNGSVTSRIQKVTQVQDNATFVHGRHTVQFGGDFTYQNSPTVFLSNYTGTEQFASLGGFLSGLPTSFTLANGDPLIRFKEPDFSLYVQDDWKVRSNLTFNLGMRYEFFDQAINTLHDVTVKRESNPATAIWNTALPLAARTYPYTPRRWKNFQPRLGFAFNPSTVPGLVLRGGYSIQFDPSVYAIFLNNYASAPVVNTGSIVCTTSCLPTDGSFTAASVRAANLTKIPTGVDPRTRALTQSPDNFQNPYVQTYQLAVQYQVGHIGTVQAAYVGNHVAKQFQTINPNPYVSDIASAFPSFGTPAPCATTTATGFGRLNCDYGSIRQRGNTGFSIYNSLQTQIKTQDWHHLTAFINYTYSKVITNSDGFGSVAGGGTSASALSYSSTSFAQNPLDTNVAERGVADYSYPHVISLAMVYQTPKVASSSRLLKSLLDGYSISPSFAANGGQYWTPIQPLSGAIKAYGTTSPNSNAYLDNSRSYCDYAYDAAWITWDACRPVLQNRSAPINSVGIFVQDANRAFSTNGTGYYNYRSTDANGLLNQPIDPSTAHYLFNNRPLARLRNTPYPGVQRNPERGQSYINLDVAISKTTAITERVSVGIYANAFNVMNRNFLGTPDSYLGDSTFGSNSLNSGYYSYSTINPASGVPASRYVQLGGKIIF